MQDDAAKIENNEQDPTDSVPLTYQPPVLVEYGTIGDLTKSVIGPPHDGNSGLPNGSVL